MSGEGRLRAARAGSPVDAPWLALPAEWRGPVIGPGIADWEKFSGYGGRRIDLTGLPVRIARELAWMTRWQAMDGTRVAVLAMNQLANILRRAMAESHPFPGSMLDMDWDTAAALRGWFCAARWGRLPPRDGRSRLRAIFRFARLALRRRAVVGTGRLASPMRPEDPAGRARTPGQPGMPARPDQPALAAGRR